MDNAQHYQPMSELSHALNPQQTYASSQIYPKPATRAQNGNEDEDDGDEGMVEEQLSYPDPEPHANTENKDSMDVGSSTQEPEQKRRPGRPRGSKNRKNRTAASASSSTQPAPAKPSFQYANHAGLNASASTTSAPPPHPDINTQNQQYYEFQWRVLNLCAEFYGAAEELVKATPPLVMAQCYHMGPSVKVDPLFILSEAKRVCDTLVANPSRLITNPPPPVVPTYFPPVASSSKPETSAAATQLAHPPAAVPAVPSAVINQPQSFVVSMGTHAQYPIYPQYGTMPYYSYPGYQPPGAPAFYAGPQPSASTTLQQAPPQASTSQVLATTSPATVGAWTPDEEERLRKLCDDAKNAGHTSDAIWEWVTSQWGSTRTKHAIYIKAVGLGLKESSNKNGNGANRGTKRRREDGEDAPSAVSPRSQPESTPNGSPSMAHLQRNNTVTPAPPVSASTTPAPVSAVSSVWPLPSVAVNTPSPVMSSSNFYRPRPSGEAPAKPAQIPQQQQQQPVQPIGHTYISYQPSANSSRMTTKKQ